MEKETIDTLHNFKSLECGSSYRKLVLPMAQKKSENLFILYFLGIIFIFNFV